MVVLKSHNELVKKHVAPISAKYGFTLEELLRKPRGLSKQQKMNRAKAMEEISQYSYTADQWLKNKTK